MPHIVVVSDGTGRTAEQALAAALTQFEGQEGKEKFLDEIIAKEAQLSIFGADTQLIVKGHEVNTFFMLLMGQVALVTGAAGAIGMVQGSVTLVHTTVADNTSNDVDSGAFYNDGGSLVFYNSIVADNHNDIGASEFYTLNGGVVSFSGLLTSPGQTASL